MGILRRAILLAVGAAGCTLLSEAPSPAMPNLAGFHDGGGLEAAIYEMPGR